MAYQSTSVSDESPLLSGKGVVDVVEEGSGFDEINGTRSASSRRGRRGAAVTLLLLAVGAVSALSTMRGRSSSVADGADLANMAIQVNSGVDGEFAKYSELSEKEMTDLFETFVTNFQKVYSDEDEVAMRFEIFRRNLKHIDQRNEGSQRARHGVTSWTDLTLEEYKSFQTNGRVSEAAKAYGRSKAKPLKAAADEDGCQSCVRYPELEKYIDGDLPKSFDWRDYGAVTNVKNQAYCGSCWSFSTTGCLEGAWYLAGHPLQMLSEQQLVTCDTEWNQGCNGGWPSLSMLYIEDNGGIVPEDIYPYRKVYMNGPTSHPPVCADVVKKGNYAATLSIEVAVAEDTMDEDTMARWLILNGPLSVALDASGMEYYDSGIDMGEYCEDPVDIDHAVLIVGFGEEDGVKYWIVKNSWAIWWGERGYYRLIRGKNACGIADEATAVIVGKVEPS